mgnify:CR=1 FL=1
MKRLVENFSGFINEVKIKSVEQTKYTYQDILRLPEYEALKKIGILASTEPSAEYRSSGMITMWIGLHSVKAISSTFRNMILLAEEDESKKFLERIVISKEGFIYFDGHLTTGHKQSYKGLRLSSLKSYAENFRLIFTHLKNIEKEQDNWKLLHIENEDTVAQNRVDSIVGNEMDNIW